MLQIGLLYKIVGILGYMCCPLAEREREREKRTRENVQWHEFDNSIMNSMNSIILLVYPLPHSHGIDQPAIAKGQINGVFPSLYPNSDLTSLIAFCDG